MADDGPPITACTAHTECRRPRRPAYRGSTSGRRGSRTRPFSRYSTALGSFRDLIGVDGVDVASVAAVLPDRRIRDGEPGGLLDARLGEIDIARGGLAGIGRLQHGDGGAVGLRVQDCVARLEILLTSSSFWSALRPPITRKSSLVLNQREAIEPRFVLADRDRRLREPVALGVPALPVGLVFVRALAVVGFPLVTAALWRPRGQRGCSR